MTPVKSPIKPVNKSRVTKKRVMFNTERPIYGTPAVISLISGDSFYSVTIERDGQTLWADKFTALEDAASAYVHPFARTDVPDIFGRSNSATTDAEYDYDVNDDELQEV